MEQDRPKPETQFSGADLAKNLIEGMPDHLKANGDAAKSKEFINSPKDQGQFDTEMPVAVLRTSGAIEYDWKVGAFDDDDKPVDPIGEDGRINVYRYEPDGKRAEKTVSFDQLASWQPKFAEGQHVHVESKSAGSEGWQVANQLPNGKVQVVKSAGDGRMLRKFLPSVELMAMQQSNPGNNEEKTSEVNEHRQRITIVEGAQSAPPAEPKRGLGRLFKRS
jgi:hypothetical protein